MDHKVWSEAHLQDNYRQGGNVCFLPNAHHIHPVWLLECTIQLVMVLAAAAAMEPNNTQPITISSTLPVLIQAKGLEPGDSWMMVQQPLKCIEVCDKSYYT